MERVINIYKEIGKTPLEKIKEFKVANPEYKDKKIAYAGRLDPLAHGVLLLLVDPETRSRKKYERLSKSYRFKMMFGVATDTYDTLGMITKMHQHLQIKKTMLETESAKFVGRFKQQYPPYSAVRVNGKPLFKWAREKRLTEIVIPEKHVTIHSIEVLNCKNYLPQKIRKVIVDRINKVTGDFRQERIIAEWENYFRTLKAKVCIAELKADCTSGTYIRSLINDLGGKLGTGATAFEILRTRVGDAKLEKSLRIN